MLRGACLVLAAALTLAACGGSSDNNGNSGSSGSGNAAKSGGATGGKSGTSKTGTTGSSGGGQNLKLSADPSGQLKFTRSSLTAKSGNVTITMDNPSQIPHAIAVEGHGVDKDGKVVGHGGVSTVTVNLKPGTYEFYCPVPGHKQAGMEGKLIVQ